MRNRPAIFGDRQPSYVSKANLAAELDMSESTVDAYVQRGLLPKPVKLGGSVRWCWAEVAASISAKAAGAEDQFMAGIDNV
ncbi:MAG: AlpA family phage regulatory protein [Pseudooceanicola sp.]|nr:AlpA family phage regulatory protein [Pseudooceanicola sp.]